MKKQKHSYEEEYFENQYTVVSNFSESDAKKNDNWFRAIFHTIDPYTNILDGKNKTAIEFGCAAGAAANLLSEFGYSVTATDISSYAITRAKKIYPDITFFTHDIQKPIKNSTKYDLVLALDVIEHLEDPQRAITNMYNLIKPKGIVVCATPNDYAHEKLDPTHISVKKPEAWKKLFLKAGFKKVEIRQKTFVPLLYRYHWRLGFAIPIGINFHLRLICSPVFIFARK